MKAGIVFMFLLLAVWSVKANNVRIEKEANISTTSIINDIALVNMDIAWDNSWRDEFNWDAVYIFLKYKLKTETTWKHAYLMDNGHRIGSSGFEYQMAKSVPDINKCTGIFVQRGEKGCGPVHLSLQLRWLITVNGLRTVDFMNDNVEYQASCIEMVYVPMGAFCLGDGISTKTFQRHFRPILPEWDCLSSDTTKMSYWATGNFDSDEYKAYPPENAVNRINNRTELSNAWKATEVGEVVWQVNFKDKPRCIRYFGVSGLSGYGRPETWRLRAKNEGTGWVTFWEGKADSWYIGNNSYPIQHALKTDSTLWGRTFQYYQIHVVTSGNSPVVANNIAMTEVDLSTKTNDAFVIDRASGIVMDMETNLSAKDDGDTWSGTLQANYPTGFNSFYVMKYEISQEQWVRFLNKLEYNQQKLRTIGDQLDGLTVGRYVYGTSNRNGITIGSRDNGAIVFVNNLTDDMNNEFAQTDDGQTVACNYLSPADMLAYADWCGLRPLSEMEYEKMSRPPYPEVPLLREWAGGAPADIVQPAGNSLANARTAQEKINTNNGRKVNVNAGGSLGGPVRVGCTAENAASRTEAGASFWGILDLSGNLSEIYYACTNGHGRNFSDVLAAHGDGMLVANSTAATAGNTDMNPGYWPQTANSFILRGGNFQSNNSELAVSDRSKYNYFSNMNAKDSVVTFRLGHSVSKLQTVDATPKTFLTLVNGVQSLRDGSAVDSVCSQASYLIRGTDVTTLPEWDGSRYSYIWYKSENDGINWDIIRGEEGCNLNYRDFYNESGNPITVLFKRRTQTSTWTDETKYVAIKVINTGYTFNRLRDTITIANHSLGFWVDTKTNARFVWKWRSNEGDVILHATQSQMKYDYYAPLRRQFTTKDVKPQRLICEMNFMGRCVKKQELEVTIVPRPTTGVLSTSIAINASKPENECGAMMQDNRGGIQLYKTVRIGDQCWMAENLRYIVPGNVSQYPEIDPTGEITGAFYAWHSRVHEEACPSGWRIPENSDFDKLKNYVEQHYGGDAGIHLKQGAYWDFHAGKQFLGDNKTGFGMAGTGYYSYATSFNAYSGNDGLGNYYTSSAYMCSLTNWYGSTSWNSKDFGWWYHWSWYGYRFPIRCIKQ